MEAERRADGDVSTPREEPAAKRQRISAPIQVGPDSSSVRLSSLPALVLVPDASARQ
jgi:hypothetical protein